MTRQEILLTILAEECVETAQRCTKAVRFGMQEIQKDQPLTNEQRIIYEFNDIVAVIGMMQDEGFITIEPFDEIAVVKKQKKIEKYLKYSEELNILK